jgi:hypothetical protein
MQQGAFTDHIVHELTSDLSLLDSIVGLTWSKTGALLLRVQPVNPEAWREIGELVVDRLRELAERLKFKARMQLLNVNGVRNMVFAITPSEQKKRPTTSTKTKPK